MNFLIELRNLLRYCRFKMLSLVSVSLFQSIPLDERCHIATEIFSRNSGQNLNKSQILELYLNFVQGISL
jgi:hypothetical protein